MDYLIIHSYFGSSLERLSDLAIQLQDKQYQVGLCMIDADDPCDMQPFGLWPVLPKRRRKAAQLKSILEEHGVNTWFYDESKTEVCSTFQTAVANINDADELKNFSYEGVNFGRGVLSDLIMIFRNPYPQISQHRQFIQNTLIASYKIYKHSFKIILKERPKKVVVFNGRQATPAAIVCAAQSAGIEVNFVEAGANRKKFNLFDFSFYDIRYFKALVLQYWGDGGQEKEKIAHDFFVLQRAGKHDWNYLDNQLVGNVPQKNGRRISYFSSSDDEIMCTGQEDCQDTSRIFDSQREAIQYLIAWVAQQDNIELVIRVHPHISKKHVEDQQFWNKLSGKNILLIPSFSSVDTYGLLESSDIVVTYMSTVGLEATFWGRASIVLSGAAFTAPSCYCPSSEHELLLLLENENLPPFPRETCFPIAYFLECNGNFEHRYYQEILGSNGKFCNKELTMDLWIIYILKKSFIGRSLKMLKNEWLHYSTHKLNNI